MRRKQDQSDAPGRVQLSFEPTLGDVEAEFAAWRNDIELMVQRDGGVGGDERGEGTKVRQRYVWRLIKLFRLGRPGGGECIMFELREGTTASVGRLAE